MQKLIDMEIEKARKAKWEAGKQEHGLVMEEDPLEALFSEALDGMNYACALQADKGLTYGSRLIAGEAFCAMQWLALAAKTMKKMNPDRQYAPRIVEFE